MSKLNLEEIAQTNPDLLTIGNHEEIIRQKIKGEYNLEKIKQEIRSIENTYGINRLYQIRKELKINSKEKYQQQRRSELAKIYLQGSLFYEE